MRQRKSERFCEEGFNTLFLALGQMILAAKGSPQLTADREIETSVQPLVGS